MNPAPFLVLGLPRSRTAWLSRFLAYGPWVCGHDQAVFMRSIEDVRSWLTTPFAGSVETAVAPFWRLLLEFAPEMRIVIVRRPVASVVDSLLALGLPDLTREMTRLDAKLQQVANRWPGAITVRYSELDDEDTCKRIFEHCLQMPHDPAWWSKLSSENIQINFAGAMRYHIAHLPQINKLMALARQTSLDLLSRRPVSPLDGVEFAVEPFERFYGDAQRAFSAHLAMTDQVPDPSLKNIDLFQRLDDAGELQCVSARHNGRIVGYLMTAIGPSLDSPGLISGWHAPFYADPAFVGLGMRLQRFSRDALRARGVNEIIMRAGVRGDGPRLGTIYRRLGAERLGEIYRLKME